MLDHAVTQFDHAAHGIAEFLRHVGRVVAEQKIKLCDGFLATLLDIVGHPALSRLAKRKLSSRWRAESLPASMTDHRSSKLPPSASREAVISHRDRKRPAARWVIRRKRGRAAPSAR